MNTAWHFEYLTKNVYKQNETLISDFPRFWQAETNFLNKHCFFFSPRLISSCTDFIVLLCFVEGYNKTCSTHKLSCINDCQKVLCFSTLQNFCVFSR